VGRKLTLVISFWGSAFSIRDARGRHLSGRVRPTRDAHDFALNSGKRFKAALAQFLGSQNSGLVRALWRHRLPVRKTGLELKPWPASQSSKSDQVYFGGL